MRTGVWNLHKETIKYIVKILLFANFSDFQTGNPAGLPAQPCKILISKITQLTITFLNIIAPVISLSSMIREPQVHSNDTWGSCAKWYVSANTSVIINFKYKLYDIIACFFESLKIEFCLMPVLFNFKNYYYSYYIYYYSKIMNSPTVLCCVTVYSYDMVRVSTFVESNDCIFWGCAYLIIRRVASFLTV